MVGTVLCIEDDHDSRVLLETILDHAGDFTVLHAADGDDALALAFEYLPDLIRLDFDLPGMHGSQVLARLQEDERTSSIPVIGVSGTVNPTALQCSRCGLRGFVRKPLHDIPAFLETLKHHLG